MMMMTMMRIEFNIRLEHHLVAIHGTIKEMGSRPGAGHVTRPTRPMPTSILMKTEFNMRLEHHLVAVHGTMNEIDQGRGRSRDPSHTPHAYVN